MGIRPGVLPDCIPDASTNIEEIREGTEIHVGGPGMDQPEQTQPGLGIEDIKPAGRADIDAVHLDPARKEGFGKEVGDIRPETEIP